MDDKTILCKINYAAHQMSEVAIVGYWDDKQQPFHIDRLRDEFKRLVKLMEELK